MMLAEGRVPRDIGPPVVWLEKLFFRQLTWFAT